MMRYMMMIKATKDSEAGIFPSEEVMTGMGKLSEEMMENGVLLASGGLQRSSNGMRIAYSGGERTVTDGPFAEAKELIAGYAIIRAKSREEALEFANRAVDVHIKAGVADFEMEIRPMFDPGDCRPAKP